MTHPTRAQEGVPDQSGVYFIRNTTLEMPVWRIGRLFLPSDTTEFNWPVIQFLYLREDSRAPGIRTITFHSEFEGDKYSLDDFEFSERLLAPDHDREGD